MNQPANSLMLADGTIFENSSCGYANGTVWCWIKGKSMAECFAAFSNPEKTSEIICMYQTNKGLRCTGFTEMMLIRQGEDVLGNETVDVRLTFREGTNHSVEEISANGEGT